MAHTKHDRVQETTTSAGGTGALTLAGAASGMRAFSSVKSNGDTFWGLITYGSPVTQWEISLCTYNSGGGTISRGTVLASSTGSAVSFSAAGAKTITDIAPASKEIVEDNNGDVSVTRDLAVGRNLAVTGGATIAGLTSILSGIATNAFQAPLLLATDGSTGSVYIRQLGGLNQIDSYNSAASGYQPFAIDSSSLKLRISGTDKIQHDGSTCTITGILSALVAANRQLYIRNLTGTNRIDSYDYPITAVQQFNLNASPLVLETGNFYPNADGSQTLGGASNRWSVVYATTGAINTSDENEKGPLRAASAAEIAVAVELAGKFSFWQYKDAIARKGNKARWHFGLSFQRVRDTFMAHDLDPFAYACVGFDELDKVERYTETVMRPVMRKVAFTEKVVEIVDGRPVMVEKTGEREEPAGELVDVTENGEPVMVPVPETEEQRAAREALGLPAPMTPLKHFVPQMEATEEERTRTVPDLDENGERRIRGNVRPDQLIAFIAFGLAHRIAALEAA